jgi:hypothetical protein
MLWYVCICTKLYYSQRTNKSAMSGIMESKCKTSLSFLSLIYSLLTSNLDGIFLPYDLPIPEQQRRHRNESNGQKAQQTVPPT